MQHYLDYYPILKNMELYPIIKGIFESETYINGLGHSCKLPVSQTDRYYILRAISKRFIRKIKILLDIEIQRCRDFGQDFGILEVGWYKKDHYSSCYFELENVLYMLENDIDPNKNKIIYRRKL